MRVIGVDPGYDRMGVAVMELVNGSEHLIYSDCIETDPKLSIHERILTLANGFEEILVKYKPNTLGIETLFFNKNQKTALGVSQARGVILYLAQKYNCKVYEFGPQEIKVAVTGYGKSDKAGIIDMVQRLVKNSPTKALDDEYDAIAVSITCLASYGRNQ